MPDSTNSKDFSTEIQDRGGVEDETSTTPGARKWLFGCHDYAEALTMNFLKT